MVIACPNCSRKYQIDTTRIPANGTSFTCWSCRAPVRVETPSAAAEPAPAVTPPAVIPSPAPPAAPPPVEAQQGRAPEPGSSIPPAAMRFFESLAAEATLKRQMPGAAAESSREGAGPATAAGASPAPAPSTGPHDVATRDGETTQPFASQRAERATMDMLRGDDVLELPDVRVIPGATTGDIIDIGLAAREQTTAEIASPAGPSATTSEIASPGEAGSVRDWTREIASGPASDAETYEEDVTFDAGTAEIASPPAPSELVRPTLQLATPPHGSLETAPAEHEAGTGATAGHVATPSPPAEPSWPPRVWPSRPVLVPPPQVAPPAAAEPPPVAAGPEATAALESTQAIPATVPLRAIPPVTPAIAPAPPAVPNGAEPPRAWVAPEVDGAREPTTGRSWFFALSLVLAVAVSLGLAWRFLSATTSPRDATAESSRAPIVAPESAAAADQDGQSAPQTPAEPATSQAAAASAPSAEVAPEQAAPAVTGAPAFTVQLRSSPDESDSRAFADSLKASGFDAYVARADLGGRGVWYRVRVGRFGTRGEAQQQLAKLRADGLARDAIVVADDGQ